MTGMTRMIGMTRTGMTRYDCDDWDDWDEYRMKDLTWITRMTGTTGKTKMTEITRMTEVISLPADVRWGSVVTHSFLPTDVCGEAMR